MFGVAPDAFLQDRAEIVPEFCVARGILGTGFQLGQHAVGYGAADAGQHRRGLQHFAAYVQRQVLGIHHAHHEAQELGQDLGVAGDEHAAHVQAHVAVAVIVQRIERTAAGTNSRA